MNKHFPVQFLSKCLCPCPISDFTPDARFLSNIYCVKILYFSLQEKWPLTQEISHDFWLFDALHCHHCLLLRHLLQSQTESEKCTGPHEQVSFHINLAASLSNQVDFWHFSCTLFCRATYKEVYMYMYKTENGKFFANCRRCSKTACNCLHALYIILFCAFNRIKAAASEPWSRAIKKHRDL